MSAAAVETSSPHVSLFTAWTWRESTVATDAQRRRRYLDAVQLAAAFVADLPEHIEPTVRVSTVGQQVSIHCFVGMDGLGEVALRWGLDWYEDDEEYRTFFVGNDPLDSPLVLVASDADEDEADS